MDSKLDADLLASCGTYCGFCPSYTGAEGPPYLGCNASGGRPWWATEEACSIYSCMSEKGIDHHGECEDFPCEKFVGHFNPENPHGQRNALVRVGLLAYRRRHGVEKTLALHGKLGKPSSP